MVGIAEDSFQLRSFRTLPTFPAWSSTTCLCRAPSFSGADAYAGEIAGS